MTYREYLEGCGEVEKAVIVVNLIRKHSYLERLAPTARKKEINKILDTEMPTGKESEE